MQAQDATRLKGVLGSLSKSSVESPYLRTEIGARGSSERRFHDLTHRGHDGASDSLLPDELAVHGHQPEVHLEQVLEHTQLPPQVPLALAVVSVDGDEQTLSKLWVVTGSAGPLGTPFAFQVSESK